MSSRLKPSKLKEYYNSKVSIEERVKKIDEEIKKLKYAILEAKLDNPMLSNSLKKNLASLLQLREYIQILDLLEKESKNN